MSDTIRKALDIVQREEENNAMEASSNADRYASSREYGAANQAADKSEEAATNASNLEKATE